MKIILQLRKNVCLSFFIFSFEFYLTSSSSTTDVFRNHNPITFVYKIRGWSGGAMVLGNLPVLGRPTIWIAVGQGPSALAVGAGVVV